MSLHVYVVTAGPLLTGSPDAVIQNHMERFITEAAVFLQREVQLRTPQGVSGASGLLGSIQQKVHGRGTPLVRGIVSPASPYGEVIERGRRPGRGMPPRGSLLRWIEVKMGKSPEEAQRLEFVVRRSIGRKGFAGVHMFERAFKENQPQLEAMAQREGLLIAQELSR